MYVNSKSSTMVQQCTKMTNKDGCRPDQYFFGNIFFKIFYHSFKVPSLRLGDNITMEDAGLTLLSLQYTISAVKYDPLQPRIIGRYGSINSCLDPKLQISVRSDNSFGPARSCSNSRFSSYFFFALHGFILLLFAQRWMYFLIKINLIPCISHIF